MIQLFAVNNVTGSGGMVIVVLRPDSSECDAMRHVQPHSLN